MNADGRAQQAQRCEPANRLFEAEREAILQDVNYQEYAHMPPSKIVPGLADQDRHIASASTFFRVLREAGQCYRTAGLDPVWDALVNEIRLTLRRKSAFMPGFERLVQGDKPNAKLSFLDRTKRKGRSANPVVALGCLPIRCDYW